MNRNTARRNKNHTDYLEREADKARTTEITEQLQELKSKAADLRAEKKSMKVGGSKGRKPIPPVPSTPVVAVSDLLPFNVPASTSSTSSAITTCNSAYYAPLPPFTSSSLASSSSSSAFTFDSNDFYEY